MIVRLFNKYDTQKTIVQNVGLNNYNEKVFFVNFLQKSYFVKTIFKLDTKSYLRTDNNMH